MLASELIKELSAEIVENGDREIWIEGTAGPRILSPAQRVRSDIVKPVETMRLYDLRDLFVQGSPVRPIAPSVVEPLSVTVIEL